jgi:arylsulfate sulfotransferase
MKMTKTIMSVCASLTLLTTFAYASAYAPAPPAGKAKKLGYIDVDPYKYAPLTALIRLDNHDINDVTVTVHPKGKDGIPISYKVGRRNLLTNDGVPVWGLYQDYKNKVTVEWTENGKKMQETYKIITAPLVNKYMDSRSVSNLQTIKVKKVAKGFENRLYMMNTSTALVQGSDFNWVGSKKKGAKPFDASPSGGSITFDGAPMTYILDTKGEIRWWLDPDANYDGKSIDLAKRGYLHSVNKTKDNTWIYAMGQTWGEFDLMGKVTVHKLPTGYIDASHEARPTVNGTVLVRAAKGWYRRPDGKRVQTVRDQILEVDMKGNLLDVWDLNKILDPLRDTLLGALDQGAVCLNVNLEHSGETMNIEPDSPFGDAVGVGAGRNWAHVNSIDYDPKDDSIIISARHQGVFKIGRDKKIKWILTPNVGWSKKFADKVLTPVDAKGNKLKCDGATCEDTNFDWTYTQHSATISPRGTLTIFDNGDARGYEQPAMASDKYSRSVEYKIDEKNMTVQQVWEYGKEHGYSWYSPVTSNTQYRPETNTMYQFSGSIDLQVKGPTLTRGKIAEIDYDTKEIKVEIDVFSDKPHKPHYRAVIIDAEETFDK